jgi:multiple sugar transport system permease protein
MSETQADDWTDMSDVTSASANRVRPVRASSRTWRRFRRGSVPYLFLTPFLVGFLVFSVFPLIYVLNLSLYRTKIVGGKAFVGLENYVKAFGDPSFWHAVGNVLTFGIIQIPIMLGLALVAALLLDSAVIRRQTLLRLGFFLPFAVPTVVAALMWGYFYGQAFGPIAQVARALGMVPPQFLKVDTVIPAIANISTWQFTGYNMLIMFAALKAIPSELYEAARVDGASGLQIALRIRIPLIAPAIILTFIFSIIGTLQLFNEPRVLHDVAPTIITPNFTPNLYVYNLAFANRQFDYAAAISFSLALITAVLSSLVLFISYRRSYRRAALR